MRTRFEKIWKPFSVSILLVAIWYIYENRIGILDTLIYGREGYIDLDIAILLVGGVLVFSLQNFIAVSLTHRRLALKINFVVLTVWGAYWSYGSLTSGEGQGYAVFGLKILLITAAPILWVHRKI